MTVRNIARVLVFGVSVVTSPQVFSQDKSNEAITAEQRAAIPSEFRDRFTNECRTKMSSAINKGNKDQSRLFMENCMSESIKKARESGEMK